MLHRQGSAGPMKVQAAALLAGRLAASLGPRAQEIPCLVTVAQTHAPELRHTAAAGGSDRSWSREPSGRGCMARATRIL